MTARTSALTRGVGKIAHDIDTVARTWSEESQLVHDEAVGAELLMSREIVEQFGILFEAADRLNDLAIRQAGYLFNDYAATLQHAATAPGLHHWPDVVLAHWQRRIEHVGEGSSELAALVQAETRKFGEALFGLWRPFAAVVGRDWEARLPDSNRR